MNTLEDRLRDALRERADHSPVSPDAWERVLERSRRRRAAVRAGGLPWQARYVVPALAAAAVAGIIIAANLVAGSQPKSPAAGPVGAASYPSMASLPPPGVAAQQAGTRFDRRDVPPSSAVVSGQYTVEGRKILGTFWLGHRSPALWFDNLSPGVQMCSSILNIYATQAPEYGTSGPEQPVTDSSGQSSCQPAPQLTADQVVAVTSGISAGSGAGAFATLTMRAGIAAGRVASVTAVLPDGRTFAGLVATGRGFPGKVWSVSYPPGGSVRLVFRDSSGHQVAALTSPPVPARLTQRPAARPASGGVPLADGSLAAYLIDGHVGFWPAGLGAPVISPDPVGRGPALAGVLTQVQSGPGSANGPSAAVSELVGYAAADVTHVVIRLAGPSGVAQVTVATFAAGWPGTPVRLWAIDWPPAVYLSTSKDTVTAYNAAGQAVAVIHHLGSTALP
jgi:hypothetical protein